MQPTAQESATKLDQNAVTVGQASVQPRLLTSLDGRENIPATTGISLCASNLTRMAERLPDRLCS